MARAKAQPKKRRHAKNPPRPRSRRPPRVGKKGSPAPRKVGRPPILTPELSREIVASVAAGNYIETAAALAGVDKDSLYDWTKKGARFARSGREDLDPHESLLVEFSGAMKAAQAKAESKAVVQVLRSKDWRASAWWLERARRDRFSPKQTIRVGQAGPEAGEADLSSLSTEELEQFVALMAKAQEEKGGEPTEPDSEDSKK